LMRQCCPLIIVGNLIWHLGFEKNGARIPNNNFMTLLRFWLP
jgi:hypothetical protein